MLVTSGELITTTAGLSRVSAFRLATRGKLLSNDPLCVENRRMTNELDVDEDGYEAPIWLPPEEVAKLQAELNQQRTEILERLSQRRTGNL